MNMNEHSVTALGGTRFNLCLMRQTHRLVSQRKNLMNDATVIDAATLQAYPKVTQDTYDGTTKKDVFVEDFKRWTTLDSFKRPECVWKLYTTK
jgi:hypothetical protein